MTDSAYGVHGVSQSGHGMHGDSMQGFRRVGTTTSTTNAAVWGENRSGAGGIGVVGASDSFRGVYAFDGVCLGTVLGKALRPLSRAAAV